jgi:GT2 family glycosyltransferase
MAGAPMAERPIADDLTVVIPTLGRPLLRDCLRSIAAGSRWPRAVIVVDQGRDPASDAFVAELVREGLAIDHVRSTQVGIAAATNRGLERVGTPFVATTHDDCRVREDWVETMSRRLPGIGEAVLTGRVEPEGEGLVLTVITRDERRVYREPMIDRDVLFPPNMGMPLTVLDRVGYLDEHLSLRLAGEDNDWAYRALRARVPIVYEPALVVGHVGWEDPRRRAAMYRRYARGQGSFYGKHVRRGDPFILRRAARDLARGPWLLARGLVTRNDDLTAMGWGAVTGLAPGIVAGLRNDGRAVRRSTAAR